MTQGEADKAQQSPEERSMSDSNKAPMKTYCLGYSHKKCDACQHVENWHTLNQMPNALRLSLQKDMTSINIDKCRLTNMGEYQHHAWRA